MQYNICNPCFVNKTVNDIDTKVRATFSCAILFIPEDQY